MLYGALHFTSRPSTPHCCKHYTSVHSATHKADALGVCGGRLNGGDREFFLNEVEYL